MSDVFARFSDQVILVVGQNHSKVKLEGGARPWVERSEGIVVIPLVHFDQANLDPPVK